MKWLESECLFDSHSKSAGRAPFFTVCLSMYSFEKTGLRALKTLLEQTFRDYEVLISDDCSPDSTVAVLLDFLQTYDGPVRVRLYRASENGGIVRNRLRGMYYANGEWIVQADGDDFSMPQRLERIKTFIDKYPRNVSIIATNAIRWYEETQSVGDRIFAETEVEDFPPDNPVYGKAPVFSAGFVIQRRLFEQFASVEVPAGLIADDPVFAKRALLVDGLAKMPEPCFYYGTSHSSASGGGVSGKRWIIDRIRRWDLLKADLELLSKTRIIPQEWFKAIAHERSKMEVDAAAIDAPLGIWVLRFLQMLCLSPREASYMVKKRIKLILRGSVNASWR